MEKNKIIFVWFFVVCVVLAARTYTDEEVLLYISRVPERERLNFLKHAVIKGYEFTHRESSGLEIPDTEIEANPQMLKAIYRYFLKYHIVSDIIVYPHPLDIICFPTGCIEINDPGIHP